ncbi:hypothetical protein AAFF_G00015930 [Aldrovandia affinis]|uniref:Cystatin domain-containing protein n=1 Tax=Aldrovandia affinis TaxID=143900 RepID=A0AAD7R373_9TELE|nr:hypothetical protein AAFF_G00015930 [Aldrovandia affinis]
MTEQKPMIVGGWGPIQPATPEVQDLCNKVLPQIEKMVAMSLHDVRALRFRHQIVAGSNYRILAKSGEHYLSVFLFVPLYFVPELTGAEFLPTA